MQKIYLVIGIFTLFITSLVIGILSYRITEKKRYSFLNMFPFEMKSKKNDVFTLIFRIFITLTISLMCVTSLYLLFFNPYTSFLNRALSCVMLLTNIMMISLFIITFKSYSNHINAFAIFVTLVFISYLLFGYITIRKPFDVYYLYQTIISFIGAGIIFLIMLFPPLSSWYKIKKEKGSEEPVKRNKFNLLSSFEWLAIILYISLYILIALSNI